MSKRRNKNVHYDDDYDDDDYDYDNDFVGSPLSPSAAQYMFRRTPTKSGQNGLLHDYFEKRKPTPSKDAERSKHDDAMADVIDALGDDLFGHSEEHVAAVLRQFNYNVQETINELLNSNDERLAQASDPLHASAGAPFEMEFDDDANDSPATALKSDSTSSTGSARKLGASLNWDSPVVKTTMSKRALAASTTSLAAPLPNGQREFVLGPSTPTTPSTPSHEASSARSDDTKRDDESEARGGAPGTGSATKAPVRATTQRNGAKQRELEALLAAEAQATAAASAGEAARKEHVNLVVIGHVDAGKSTINGHLLVLTGRTDERARHRFERDAKAAGKASFAFAWALDEHAEERARGITINVGMNYFETPRRHVTLLDAPGHRDFVPNMIGGAAQADFAVLVVDATPGEFETGFSDDGQTKEHAILARSLGVTQLIVAVNKMDTVDWSQARFETICAELTPFLKKSGFKPAQVRYVPVSGLTGANLTQRPNAVSAGSSRVAAAENADDGRNVAAWYEGPTLLECIDTTPLADRVAAERLRPLRFVVSDVYRNISLGLAVGGRVEAGCVMPGDRVLLAPLGETATVKAVHGRESALPFASVGDNVDLGLTNLSGAAAAETLAVGDVLCDPAHPVPQARTIRAQLITFAVGAVPLTQGAHCVFHAHAIEEACVVARLVALTDRATGNIKKKKPRLVPEGATAVVDITFSRALPLEAFKECKQLGRFMLRKQGKTLAAGIVLEVN